MAIFQFWRSFAAAPTRQQVFLIDIEERNRVLRDEIVTFYRQRTQKMMATSYINYLRLAYIGHYDGPTQVANLSKKGTLSKVKNHGGICTVRVNVRWAIQNDLDSSIRWVGTCSNS